LARVCLLATLVILMLCHVGMADPQLLLEGKIPLGSVSGRIDHLAIDLKRQRLFVAELGNGSVGIVDLAGGKLQNTMIGFKEPQGIGVEPASDAVYIANAGDGSVRIARAEDLTLLGRIELGDDADNVRVDSRNGNLVVGYGSGALAVIDPAEHRVIRQLTLPGHPEGFELIGPRAFVNVPDAHKIAVGDLDQGRVISTLSTGLLFDNYPMASDAAGSRIAVGYRLPGTLLVVDSQSTAITFSVSVCRDADEVYFYAGRVVVICGEGAVELVQERNPHSSVRVATQRGARTGLLDPLHNRLFVAVPARQGMASLWELSSG